MNKYTRTYILILFFAVSPLLAALFGIAISNFTGEEISVAKTAKSDLGKTAYMLFMMHWLAIATVPFGILLALANSIQRRLDERKNKKQNLQ